MDPKYSFADEVEDVALQTICKSHKFLRDARIKYLFRSGKWEKNGKIVLGQAKLASEDTRFIADVDFVIIINLDAWNNASTEHRFALVDHELSHCDFTEDNMGNRTWKTTGHDVEEFVAVVYRHGLWEDDLRKMMLAAKENDRRQIELIGMEVVAALGKVDEKEPEDSDQSLN
ncbi:MAG: putative metallopeptidase [Negativicutes bacterium]